MKVSYDILKQFVKPPKAVSVRELAETLTMHTVEVDGYAAQAERLDNIVVGVVEKVSAHPNADKLKLATVEAGKEKFDVVCGGVNLQQGMKVAFARVGALVRWHGEDKWTTLTSAKIRDVKSNGMICAAEELELVDPEPVEGGIMDLSYLKAKPGTPLSEALGLGDVILDIDNKSITHRPDLWGHLGLARELAAVWGVPFVPPEPPAVPLSNQAKLTVSIKVPEQCRRYLGVVLGGIKVAESPTWLKERLASLGQRSVNNVVDVTNYVMFEYGQPLHAFDRAKLASADMVVRKAKKGEVLKTLDGAEHKLDGETLVIADKKHAQAIAGIMGGAASEVSPSTTHIVLESANFEAVSIRQTATRLGMRTEASARFEKALDPGLAELALRRAVELLKEVVPGCEVESPVVDEFPTPLEIAPIELNLPWLTRRLGTEVSQLKVQQILGSLGFKLAGKGDTLMVTPPSWRATRDVTIPEDLIEEVARIYGYGKIPLAMPKFDITPPKVDDKQALLWKVKDYLVGEKWSETLSYSFVDKTENDQYVDTAIQLELENPIDRNKRYLRGGLLGGLANQIFINEKRLEDKFIRTEDRENHEIKMFEVGRVFSRVEGVQDVTKMQGYHLVLCLLDSSGKDERDVFEKLKGVITTIFSFVGVESKVVWREGKGYEVYLGKERIGTLSFITKPSFTVSFCEVDLDGLPTKIITPEYIKPPIYPAIDRDLTIIVTSYPSDSVNWFKIKEGVAKIDALIESVGYLGYYSVKNTLTFRTRFRSSERTLKSDEVDEVMVKITKLLEQEFGAKVRS